MRILTKIFFCVSGVLSTIGGIAMVVFGALSKTMMDKLLETLPADLADFANKISTASPYMMIALIVGGVVMLWGGIAMFGVISYMNRVDRAIRK